MTGYTGEDGRDRRDQWYNNKELFEKIEKMAEQFISMEKSLIRFENKFERYNGLHEKINEIEDRPCRQGATIQDLCDAVKEVSDYVKRAEHIKEYQYKRIAAFGTAVGIVGGVLGILALLGVL